MLFVGIPRMCLGLDARIPQFGAFDKGGGRAGRHAGI